MPDGNQGSTQISDPSGNVYISQPGGVDMPSQGAASAAADVGSVSISTAAETTVSVLGGLISPSDVTETRPGRGGDGADALILRRLARAEGRIAKLESTQ